MLAIIPRAFRWAALFLSFNSLALSQQASVADVLEHSSLTLPSRLSLPEAERLLAARSLAATANRFQLQASLAARTIAGYKPNPTLQIAESRFLSGRRYPAARRGCFRQILTPVPIPFTPHCSRSLLNAVE